METFVEEFKSLQRVMYKSKNAHRSTLYYKKTIHAQRLIKKYLNSGVTKRTRKLLLEEIRDRCEDAYIAVSSNIALGHNLGLAIGLMSIIARLYSLTKHLENVDVDKQESYIVRDPDSSTSVDEISDIFK